MTIVKVFVAHESSTKGEKRLNPIALLQHGHSTHEVSKLLGISQPTCFRIHRESVPQVEPSRGGCPQKITPTQRRVCVTTITIGGLDNVVDVTNALSEHQHNEACTP